jgi:UDP-GlcNAc3NAcA epimerase
VKKIATIIGARPQFIKAAVVSRLLQNEEMVEEVLIHTGQHFDANMSEIFFKELDIPRPRYELNISGGGHGQMTGRMMEAVEEVLTKENPDLILVYGDTNSTLAGALTAAKMHIPVAHIEAGLRSFNRQMPEEINRVLTDHISALLLCPTQTSIDNLEREGVRDGVHLVGDVMFDATLFASEQARERSKILQTLGLIEDGYGLCTLHRAENTDDPERFETICRFIEAEAENVPIIFPVHPRTRQVLESRGRQLKGVTCIEPVGYFDLHQLLGGATILLTDSGGLQKEAYFHRKPCITLRDETEWVETLDAGWNRLWTSEGYCEPRRTIADYGDGHSGEKMVSLLLDQLF